VLFATPGILKKAQKRVSKAPNTTFLKPRNLDLIYMADFVRKNAIKAEVKKVGKDMRCPDATIEAFDKVIKGKLARAVERAKGNGRKTLRAWDF
jgi:histone H3/H4